MYIKTNHLSSFILNLLLFLFLLENEPLIYLQQLPLSSHEKNHFARKKLERSATPHSNPVPSTFIDWLIDMRVELITDWGFERGARAHKVFQKLQSSLFFSIFPSCIFIFHATKLFVVWYLFKFIYLFLFISQMNKCVLKSMVLIIS